MNNKLSGLGSGSSPPFSLYGKTAIVTGGGNGIGRATAGRLVSLGARVILVDFDEVGLNRTLKEIEAEGGEAIGIVGDATEEESAVKAVSVVMERWGRLDILVNVVGINYFRRIWEMPPEDWDMVMRRNLRPMFLFTRQAAPIMIKAQSGRVICISSGARDGTPWTAVPTGNAAYSTTKAGIHGFIRDMAFELGEYGVTINAVAPGPINTEKAAPHFKRLEAEGMYYTPHKVLPLKRIGEPVEIADTVAFLASDEAGYITGQTIDVNGGR